MLVLGVGDSLRGSASVADKIDYSFHGYAGTTISLLAEGQLAVADGELYPAAAIAVVKAMALVNTHTAAITINLTILKSGSVARRLIPKDLSLGIGYSLYFEGSRFSVVTPAGEIVTSGVGEGDVATDTIWDTAGDTVYGTGPNAAAILAAGAANLQYFMNAAGTAPEWAAGMKMGTFYRAMNAASGNVEYSGIGFKPSHVLLWGGYASIGLLSIGVSDGTSHHCIRGSFATAGNYTENITRCVDFQHDAANSQDATVDSFDADGFTLAWVRTGTAQIYSVGVLYLAFR